MPIIIPPVIDPEIIAELEYDLRQPELSLDLADLAAESLGLDLDQLTPDDLTLKTQIQTRIHAPAKTRLLHPRLIVYENASRMADEIGPLPTPGERVHAVISGNFIAGDFLEAWITTNDWHCPDLHVATLSLSQSNIDSLGNLLHGGYVQRLHLLVSDYWYAHERVTEGLLPYAYKELDRFGGDRFQLAVANSHAKLALIATADGARYVMHGSANLRSSASIEQFALEHDPELYDFHRQWLDALADQYHTIYQQQPGRTAPKRQQWQTVVHSAESTTPVPAQAGKRK